MGLSILSGGCSLLFDTSAEPAVSDASVPDAVVDFDAGTPRLPVDEQFVGCGKPLEGYANRVQVVIDYEYTAPLSGFPLLVAVPPDVLASLEVRDDAMDLRFASGYGEQLTYETELLDPEATSYFWVQATVAQTRCSRSIWMYGGNPEPPPLDEHFTRKTWGNAAAVWHFSDEGDAQKNSVDDGAVAIKQGNHTALSIAGEGVVGRAQRNSRFRVEADEIVSIGGESTWESRFYVRDPGLENQRSLDYGGHLTLIATRSSSAKDSRIPAVFAEGLLGGVFVEGVAPMTEGWHYMAATLERTSDDQRLVRLYLDGEQIPHDKTMSVLETFAVDTEGDPLRLGLHDGDIDEARVWTVARPPEWIELTQSCFEGEAIQFSETVAVGQ